MEDVAPVEEELLAPLDAEWAGFWAGAAAGELRVQACTSCRRRRFPPRPMCPACRSTGRAWEGVSGRGRIWSFAVPHPPLPSTSFGAVAPYNVVVVALEEEPELRMVGNLVSLPGGPIDEVSPEDISIGLPVRVVFSRRPDGRGGELHFPQWVRAWRRVVVEEL